MHSAIIIFLSISIIAVLIEAGIIKKVLDSKFEAYPTDLASDDLPILSRRNKKIGHYPEEDINNDKIFDPSHEKYVLMKTTRLLSGLNELDKKFLPILYKNLVAEDKTISNDLKSLTNEDDSNNLQIYNDLVVPVEFDSYPNIFGLNGEPLDSENVNTHHQFDDYSKEINNQPLSAEEITSSDINKIVNEENDNNNIETIPVVQTEIAAIEETQNDPKNVAVTDLHTKLVIPFKFDDKNDSEAVKEDSHEFVFTNSEDMLEPQSEYDFDISTDVFIHGPRFKREQTKANIIEEENIASTINAYKYTNRPARFNNDIYFKNINS